MTCLIKKFSLLASDFILEENIDKIKWNMFYKSSINFTCASFHSTFLV